MEKNKRVYCLYRVSTKGQVEKDDIPMQKQYCREFAESQGWTIIKEFAEKGVSGFKVAAADRDAIQEIRQDAEERKFDILLVFMFDRLGRRDDETPFVVEWFIRNGIEVWSAMEGQQMPTAMSQNIPTQPLIWCRASITMGVKRSPTSTTR